MFKHPFPSEPLFKEGNPTEVVDNLNKGRVYCFCLTKGKRVYEFIPCDWYETALLFDNLSIVKYGRHWWIA